MKVLRRLLNLVAVLSLLLCISSLLLWVRSYRHEDALFVYYDPLFGERDGVLISSVAGRIYGKYSMDATTVPQPKWRITYSSATAIPWLTNLTLRRQFLGFAVGRGNPSQTFYDSWVRFAVIVPHWGLALVLAALPAARGWRLLTTRRRRIAGMCSVCGYDLRATPERCPECGAAHGRAAVS